MRIDPYWLGVAVGLVVGAFFEALGIAIIGVTVVATLVSILRDRPSGRSRS
jgi:hypothetical protein